MSETTEQPGGPAPEPVDAPAPETEAPAPETTETPEPEHKEQPDPEGRRVAALRARLGAAEREQERQRAELDFYRRQAAQQPQNGQETPEQAYQRERMAIRQEVEAQIRAENFHERGATEFPDWRQRCDDLVKMGADPGFAQLLVEMPEGVRVAAALAADPEAVERISALRSERARAVALGKYAATLDADSSPRAAPQRVAPVTRAPAPVRAVTGRAAPVFNEYSASGQALVDHYMKQNMDRQQGR